MIDTDLLTGITKGYIEHCQEHNKQPTYNGIGYCLGISGATVRHVVTGYYKDNKPYTDKPHVKRCIDNTDFRILKNIFDSM